MNCVFCGAPTSGKSRICNSVVCAEKQRNLWNEESIVVPEGYVTAKEYAKLKGQTIQGIAKQCRNGKLECFQDEKSGRWYIAIDDTQRFPVVERRTVRHRLKATQTEWNSIVEKDHSQNMSVNEYILKICLKA